MIKRYHTLLAKLSRVGITSEHIKVWLGSEQSYLSHRQSILARPSYVFYDQARQQYLFLPETIATSASHLTHLHKKTFYKDGIITDVEAAVQFLHIWLQEIQGKKNVLNLYQGEYIVLGETTPAQLVMYKEVFSRLTGSWHPVTTKEIIPQLVGLTAQQSLYLGVGEEKIELALVANGSLVHFSSLPWGTQKILHQLALVLEQKYHLKIEKHTLQALWTELMLFYSQEKNKKMSVRGQGTLTHLPANIVIELSDFFPTVFYWFEELKRELHVFYSAVGAIEELALTEVVSVTCPRELKEPLATFLTTHLKIAVNSLGSFESVAFRP